MNSSPLKRSKRRLFALAGMVLAGGLAMAGCAGTTAEVDQTDDVSADGGAPEVDPLVVSSWKTSGDTPLYYAQESGIAAEYGLNIEHVVQESAAAGAALVQAGDAQVYLGSYPGAIDGIRNGVAFRILAEKGATVKATNSVEALPDSGIEDVLDLEGKTVAVVSLNSASDLRIKYAMLEEGGDPNTINFVALPYGEMPSALELGNVDAAAIATIPRQQVIDTLGTRTVLDLGGGIFDGFAETGWITTEDNLQKYPNAVRAFQCTMQASNRALEDRPTYVSATAEFLEITEAEVEALGPVSFPVETRPDKIVEVADMMQAVGMIPEGEELDIESAIVPFPDDCDE